MDSDQSGAVGGIIWGLFQGSLTHLGACRGLQTRVGHSLFDGHCLASSELFLKNVFFFLKGPSLTKICSDLFSFPRTYFLLLENLVL